MVCGYKERPIPQDVLPSLHMYISHITHVLNMYFFFFYVKIMCGRRRSWMCIKLYLYNTFIITNPKLSVLFWFPICHHSVQERILLYLFCCFVSRRQGYQPKKKSTLCKRSEIARAFISQVSSGGRCKKTSCIKYFTTNNIRVHSVNFADHCRRLYQCLHVLH